MAESARGRFAALVLALVLGPLGTTASATPRSAPPGYDTSWCGQSGYPTIHAGDAVTLATCFTNTGTVTWVSGTASEVALAVCVDTPAPQYFACNVLSPYADWAQGWTTPRIYGGAVKGVVAPADFTFFSFIVKAPPGTTPGDYYFRGELIQRATGIPIHPVGYYHVVHVIP